MTDFMKPASTRPGHDCQCRPRCSSIAGRGIAASCEWIVAPPVTWRLVPALWDPFPRLALIHAGDPRHGIAKLGPESSTRPWSGEGGQDTRQGRLSGMVCLVPAPFPLGSCSARPPRHSTVASQFRTRAWQISTSIGKVACRQGPSQRLAVDAAPAICPEPGVEECRQRAFKVCGSPRPQDYVVCPFHSGSLYTPPPVPHSTPLRAQFVLQFVKTPFE
jgi:hypothetical protein